MKILLDESLPRRLKRDLKGHFVQTVPEAGWHGKRNGELLQLMNDKFDIFITADQNLQFQINLRNTIIPILVLISPSNRYEDLKQLVPNIIQQLKSSNLRGIVRISGK